MTCKGPNCNASKDNGHRHSSECLFEHARQVASGIESVTIGATIPDHYTAITWRGHTFDLESLLSNSESKKDAKS